MEAVNICPGPATVLQHEFRSRHFSHSARGLRHVSLLRLLVDAGRAVADERRVCQPQPPLRRLLHVPLRTLPLPR